MGTGRNIPRVVDSHIVVTWAGADIHTFHPSTPHTVHPSPLPLVRHPGEDGRSVTEPGHCCHGPARTSSCGPFCYFFGGPYVNTLVYTYKYFSYNWVPRIDLPPNH